MISLPSEQDDDPAFVKIIEKLLLDCVKIHQPIDVWLVKVDRWFGARWRGFSNKYLGAVGVRYFDNLRVPPFVPNRILHESFVTLICGDFVSVDAPPLHIRQASGDNRFRLISKLTRNGLFCWYSGGTAVNTQGSVMIYSVHGEHQNSWFVSFAKKNIWSVQSTSNVGGDQLHRLVGLANDPTHAFIPER